MKTSYLVSAAVKLALGILFVILKAEVVGICITLLGVALLVMGIIDLVHNDTAGGIVKIVLAAAVTLIGWLLLEVALIVLGIVLLVNSILDIVKIIMTAVKNKGANILAVVLGLIEPALALVASVFLITSRGTAIEWTVIIAGIVLIVNGLIALLRALVPENSTTHITEIEVEYTEKSE
jgi:hypothetical protein